MATQRLPRKGLQRDSDNWARAWVTWMFRVPADGGDLWYRGTYGFSDLMKNNIQNDAPQPCEYLLNSSMCTSHWHLKLMSKITLPLPLCSCPVSINGIALVVLIFFSLLPFFRSDWTLSSWNSTSIVSQDNGLKRNSATVTAVNKQEQIVRMVAEEAMPLWGEESTMLVLDPPG